MNYESVSAETGSACCIRKTRFASEQPTIKARRVEDICKPTKQKRNVFEKSIQTSRKSASFENQGDIEERIEILKEPTSSDWLTIRRIHKTYSRSKQPIKTEENTNILEQIKEEQNTVDEIYIKEEVCNSKSKEDGNNINSENNRKLEENETQVCKTEEAFNGCDDKIKVEYNSFEESELNMYGEHELREPKAEIIEAVEVNQNISVKFEQEVEDSNSQKVMFYKCTVCFKVLNIQQSLKIHMVVQKEKKYVFCEDCFKCFARKKNLLGRTATNKRFIRKRILRSDLDSHVTSGENKMHKDSDSGLPVVGFGWKSHKRQNVSLPHTRKRHAIESLFACNLCSKKFKRMRTLERHTRTHTCETLFLCEICGKQLRTKAKLALHVLSHAVKHTFECDICDKQYGRKIQLEEHKRIHTSERPFECDLCNKRYTCKSSLSTHKRYGHMAVEERPFACNVCDMRFIAKSAFEQHMTTHATVRLFLCNVCNKSFKGKKQLSRHVLLHTAEIRYLCEVCGKQFRHKDNFVLHERVHRSEVPFICEICNKQCRDKISLTQHKRRMHTPVFPFSCGICGRKFKEKGYLVRHMPIHSDHRPFECKVCNKSFKQKCILEYHEAIHTNEFRFACKVCGKRFKRNTVRLRHERIHITS